MTRLRLSAHTLEIETGRYSDTDAENRFCQYCEFQGNKVVEDEVHFLVTCPMYEKIREDLLPPQVLTDNTLNAEEKFVEILSNSDSIKTTAKFIHLAFTERQIKLDVLNTIKELVSSTESQLKNPTPEPGTKPSYSIKNVSQDGMKITLFRH